MTAKTATENKIFNRK